VACFVDGLNLQHSLRAAEEVAGMGPLRWLDLHRLCRSFAPLVAQDARLASIDYFTALPHHLAQTEPSRLQRHLLYLRALGTLSEPTVTVHEGRISRQTIQVMRDGRKERWETWREKGTDVALAAAVLEKAGGGGMDDAVIVSGDADYIPLATAFARMHPDKSLRFALPFRREPREIRRAAPLSFSLSAQSYAACQLPDSIALPNGKVIHRPSEWTED